VVAGPALVRLRFGPRLAVTLGVLAGFALVTRFEPSVLRATAMAAVAATGAAMGRPASSRRALGLGVAAVLLVDPLLATSLGFQLSAAGSAGIVVGARAVERVLPGPRWLRTPLAVTVAAQLAVSPLLVATFGSLPLASLPANVLAEPVAGPIMVWGLTAGLAAGVLGGPVASLLHLPTRVLLWWLDTVASRLAEAPLGVLRMPQVVAALAGVALLAWATHRDGAPSAAEGSPAPGTGRSPPPSSSPGQPAAVSATSTVDVAAAGRARPRIGALRMAGVLLAVVALVPALRPPAPGPPGSTEMGLGATAWRGDRAVVIVLDGRARADAVLSGLRERGVRRVDAVVLRSAARGAAEVAAAVRTRWPTAAVLAPATSPAVEATTPPTGAVADVGDLRLTVTTSTPDTLTIDVTRPADDP
jgi:competence protein ComEC